MEEHSTPRLCSLFLGTLHICPLFLLPLPIFPFKAWQVLPWMETLSDAEGYTCFHGQDSGGWTENMGGHSFHLLLGVRWTKPIPVSRTATPQLPLPIPAPTPQGDSVRPSREIPEFPSSLLPFLQYVQHLPAPSFQLSLTYNLWQDCPVPG